MRRHASDGTLRRLLGYVKPYVHFLILALAFTALAVALSLYVPVLIGDGIDCVIAAGRVDFTGLMPILIRLAWVIALGALAQWLSTLCTNRLTYRTVRDLRVQVMDKLSIVPLKFIDGTAHGEVISRVVADVDQVSDGLLMGFAQLFSGAATIVGTLGIMLFVNWQVALIVVLITPLSLFVASFIAGRTYKMFRQQSETRGEMTALVEEMIGGQKVVVAFGHEAEAEAQFAKINERLKDCGLKATFFSSITNPATRFVNGVVYAAVGVFGAIWALRGLMSVGQLTCLINYANQYTKPFNEISGVVTELQGAFASARRVFQLIDEAAETPDAEDALALKEVDGRVALDGVAFCYDPAAPLIEDLNLDVRPGQRIAIVGPTGCGKTTLINLLMRFYDVNAGRIAVSGHPVRTLTRDSLRRAYGMVLQETWLKAGTIFENIAYGRPEASPEEVERAARAAHAHSFIERLPQGYQTRISDESGGLSQGQRQLLCIARVMLCLPPMLILDEATSSIDTRTEAQIQRAFEEMMRGRTSFIVAHRLSTIREADCILVMNAGHIVEQGTHEELLKKDGFYAALYNSQFAG